MKSQKYNRNKREYEDLDEICSASRDYGQKCGLSHLGNKTSKFLSDTAINLTPENIHSKKLSEQISARGAFTGSIPCFFHLDSNLSTILLDEKNEGNAKSYEQSKNSLNKNYTLWLICYICLYGLYLVIGAFWFELIEGTAEQTVQANFSKLRINFLTKYPQISATDLDSIVSAAVSATSTGIQISTNNATVADLKWNFGDLLLFTTSIVTTIGYGHLSPITNAGKVFCIIYAGIGIPLTLVLLSAMVEHLFKQSNNLLKVLITKFGHAYQIFSIQILHLSILAFIFLILFLIIPAAIFASLETEWSVLDGLYFCFTSLTTIGLGDLVPDIKHSSHYGSIYKVMIAIYLIIGLIAIMLVITVFYTIPQLNIGLWLVESSANEVNTLPSFEQQSTKKSYDKTNIPEIKIESTTSSSKTLRTML